MTITECAEICAILSATYPNATFTDQSPAAWHMVLADYDTAAVMAILPSVLKDNRQFCPSAPAIAGAVDDALNPKVSAQEAWQSVLKAINDIGTYEIPAMRRSISDPATVRAADTIGWERIGHAPHSEHGTLFAQFRGCFEDAQDTARHTEHREAITGATNGLDSGFRRIGS